MKSFRVYLWVLLYFAFGALLLPMACSDGNGDENGDDPIIDSECVKREDCAGGFVCVDGICTHCSRDRDCYEHEECHPIYLTCQAMQDWGQDCSNHDVCSLGYFCVQGLCKPGDEVTPCASDAQCEIGRYCNVNRLVCEEDLGCFDDLRCPEGYYCNLGTNRCERGCTEETAVDVCPEGFVCYGGRCVECVKDDDCGAGLTCDLEAGRCRGEQHCFSDRDCLRPFVCNRLTGQCTEQPPPCLSNQDCVVTEVCDIRSGRCISAQCLPDSFEPNSRKEDAAQIEPGLYSNLTLCDGDDDWFVITLGSGDRLSFTVNPPALAGSNYNVALFEAESDIQAASGNLQLDYRADVESDYFVRVNSQDRRSTYGMQILVSRGIPCEDDSFEPNDDPTDAAVLPYGAFYNLKKCPGNADWFLLEHERGGVVEVRLEHDPLGGALDLYVYDSDSSTLMARSASTEPVERVLVEDTSAGRFYIEVVGGPRVQNSYDLIVEALPQ